MSKMAVTRLFIAGALVVIIGLIGAVAAVVAALATGAVKIGGPAVVTVDGGTLAGTLAWLVVASVVIAGGALAALASWIGALLNTVQLEDKTWFVLLLVLGLFSFGWVAMIAYILAGPDSTRPEAARPDMATAPGS